MFNHKNFLKFQFEKLIVGVIVIIILCLFSSCSNPKANIVEKEKEVKTQRSLADAMVSVFKGYKLEMEIRRYDSGYTISQVLDSMKRFDDSIGIYESKKTSLQSTYDSLEMELKKY